MSSYLSTIYLSIFKKAKRYSDAIDVGPYVKHDHGPYVVLHEGPNSGHIYRDQNLDLCLGTQLWSYEGTKMWTY